MLDKVALKPAELGVVSLVGSGREVLGMYSPPRLDAPLLANNKPEKVMVLEVELAQAQPPMPCITHTLSPFFSSSIK